MEDRAEASTPAPPAAPSVVETPPNRRRRWWFTLLLVPFVLVLGAFGIDRAVHDGHVLRGVVVDQTDLSGLPSADARDKLMELDKELRSRPLHVKVRDRHYEVDPESVAFRLQIEETLEQSMAAGRQGNVFAQIAWWFGRTQSEQRFQALATIDSQALGAQIAVWEAEAISDPPFEGAIVVRNNEPVAEAPRAGYVVDRDEASRAVLLAMSRNSRDRLTVPLMLQDPTRTARVTDAALLEARALVSGAVTLVAQRPEIPETEAEQRARVDEAKKRKKAAGRKPDSDDSDKQPPSREVRLTWEASEIAGALQSRLADDGRIVLFLSPDAVNATLGPARKELERPPIDARFVVTKRDKVEIVDSRAGTLIKADDVAAVLFKAAASATREGVFPLEVGAAPEFTTEDAKALKIEKRVSRFTTAHPCCRPRVDNIHRIADMIDGVVVKPGEKFSVNDFVGIRTRAKGFAPAPTIVDGEMEDTVGGGISQFATTLFNAAFHGGYDIVERAPHSYYFNRYPVGHEATLSFPKPDLIIRNDTEAGLLIKCTYSAASITVTLYGDNGGRKVRRKVSHAMDIVEPPVEYEADPSLDPEEEKVKERGRDGWTVKVARVIEYADGTKKEEGRKVTYNPRKRVVRVHPCKIPEGEEGHTGEECPKEEEPIDEIDIVGEGVDPDTELAREHEPPEPAIAPEEEAPIDD